MFDTKGLNYVNNSFHVFKPKYLFHKKGYIYRWQYKSKRHLGKGYSDHLPIVATFSTQAYVADFKSNKVEKGNIAELYQKTLENSLYLKNVKVILKTQYHAIIKQHQKGRAIFVYGAKGLEEGKVYDLLVNKIKNYNGLHEIVNFTIEHKYETMNLNDYYFHGVLDFNNRVLENEVLKSLEGVYQNNQLYIKDKVYPIYFKNRSNRPKDGTYLKLKKVQIGYYNRLQFVVWE
jgi:hypothetical protein